MRSFIFFIKSKCDMNDFIIVLKHKHLKCSYTLHFMLYMFFFILVIKDKTYGMKS